VLSNGAVLTLTGTLDNRGTIALAGSGDPTTLALSGAVQFEGGGALNLSDEPGNTITAAGGTATLIVATGSNPLAIDTGDKSNR